MTDEQFLCRRPPQKRQLSTDTLAVLQAFYSEQDAREKLFQDLKAGAEADHRERTEPLTMAAFAEDWNASQFWYSQETAKMLAHALLDGASKSDQIAFISSPSAFLEAKNILATDEQWTDREARPSLMLLEYDTRFAVFEEFIHYDYNVPLQLPIEAAACCTRIIVDPPFLSDECQTKAAMTVRWLARREPDLSNQDLPKIGLIVCTGERMQGLIHRLYAKEKIQTTDFVVQHQHGRLSNEFRCYSNYSSSAWNLVDAASQEEVNHV